MSLSTVIASVGSATTSAKKLFEVANAMQNVELKSTIADLMNHLAESTMDLADLKAEIAQLKEENTALRSEIASLKSAKAEGKPKVKWGCYVFEGDENLYCPACFDTVGKKYLTSRFDSRTRICTVCQRPIGS